MHQCNRRRIGSDFLYRFSLLRCKIKTLLSSWRVDWGFLFFVDDARFFFPFFPFSLDLSGQDPPSA